MKLYIAGPMTGYVDFNYRAFFDAAKALDEINVETINPARTEGREGCKSWLDFMRAALRDLADCDGIALLPGWGDSRGAALEEHVGRSLGLAVKSLDEWLLDGAAA